MAASSPARKHQKRHPLLDLRQHSVPPAVMRRARGGSDDGPLRHGSVLSAARQWASQLLLEEHKECTVGLTPTEVSAAIEEVALNARKKINRAARPPLGTGRRVGGQFHVYDDQLLEITSHGEVARSLEGCDAFKEQEFKAKVTRQAATNGKK